MSVLYGWVIGDGCTSTGTNRNSHRRKVAKQVTRWEKIARNKVPFGQRRIMCLRAYQRRARRRVSGRRGASLIITVPYIPSCFSLILVLLLPLLPLIVVWFSPSPHCCQRRPRGSSVGGEVVDHKVLTLPIALVPVLWSPIISFILPPWWWWSEIRVACFLFCVQIKKFHHSRLTTF